MISTVRRRLILLFKRGKELSYLNLIVSDSKQHCWLAKVLSSDFFATPAPHVVFRNDESLPNLKF